MEISQAGIDLIKNSEGFSPRPYRCPAGYLTIGYGHVIRRGDTHLLSIDKDAAEALLRQDVREAERAVNAMVAVPLAQHEFDALVSFVFNVGAGRFADSTLLELLNEGRRKEAAEQFGKWVRSGSKVLPGLVKRRQAERRLFLGEA